MRSISFALAVLAAALLASPATARAEKLASNAVWVEGLGPGFLYSFDYERRVATDLGVRVGLGYVSVKAETPAGTSSPTQSSLFLAIPLTASYLGLRSGEHVLELGGGVSVGYTSARVHAFGTSSSGAGVTPYGVAMIGYRLHPVDRSGFLFRIGAMALAGPGLGLSRADPSAFGFLPWAYVSVGAALG